MVMKSFNQPKYQRRLPLVLVNGLAEQPESWYCNVDAWRQHFEVHTPNLLAYDGIAIQRRIAARLPIDVDYLVEQLRMYIESYIQRSPVFLVANSLGGKIAVELTARFPDLVSRLVLLCPSGLSREERLPIVEGVRHNDPAALVESVFQRSGFADPDLIEYYRRKFGVKVWRSGLLRAVRGTMDFRVADRLEVITQPTLLVVGENDRIVNPNEAIAAGERLPNGNVVVLRDCGHAPQIEMAQRVNGMVVEFLLRSEGVLKSASVHSKSQHQYRSFIDSESA